ncbi:MAG: hypothetical protein LBP75_00620 [Planctomycetota bacterium]|jgi:lipoate-protein ligase A|nr:hypothetical protein [Planctomycetota bacterium]
MLGAKIMNVEILPVAAALAFGEARCAAGVAQTEIYFWQADAAAVAVGLAQNAAREVVAENLRADGVRLYRRQSGGGAVLLGAGILCFEILTPVVAGGDAPGIRESFQTLLAPVGAAAAKICGQKVMMSGVSDLTVGDGAGKKFCGTAQLRKRSAILVHGALLAAADLALLSRYLRYPSVAPDYRAGRAHGDFCVALSTVAGRQLTVGEVAAALAAEARQLNWRVAPPMSPVAAEKLRREKYDNEDWNWRRERK